MRWRIGRKSRIGLRPPGCTSESRTTSRAARRLRRDKSIRLSLSLAVSTALPLRVDFLGKDCPVGARFWHALDAGVSFGSLTLFFAVVFRVVSVGQFDWHYVFYGAVISTLLFTFGKFLISLYLAYRSTCVGAAAVAGSVVVFLVWVWLISSQSL